VYPQLERTLAPRAVAELRLVRCLSVKWFFTCAVGVIIAAVAWITLQYFRSLDARSAVSRATVVAHGHVVSAPQPYIVIDEIWKSSAFSGAVAIGTIIPFPARGGSADQVLVCFTPGVFSHRLSPSAILAVRSDGVGIPPVPLSELKALCAGTPST